MRFAHVVPRAAHTGAAPTFASLARPLAAAFFVVFALFGAVEAQADLNITVSPNPVSIPQGSTGSVTISSQILPGFPTNAERIEYTLANFSGGTGIGTAVTFAPGFPPTNLTILVNSTTPPGTYSAMISAIVKDSTGAVIGNKDFPNAVTINVTAAPCDFTIMPDPSSLRIPQGGSAQLRVFASATGGCSGTFSFTATTPAGVTVNSPQTTTFPNTTVNFTYTAAATAPPGTYSTTITVQGSGVTKTLNVPLEITGNPDFTVTVTPDRFNVQQGNAVTLTVTVTSLNGFAGAVTLTPENSTVLLEVTPSPFTLTVPANGSVTQALTVRARSDAPAGSANFLLRAQSGTIQKSVPIFPTITAGAQPDFTVDVAPNPLNVVAGQSAALTFTVRPVNGFTGTVTLTPQASPGLSFSTLSLQLTPNNPQQLTVTAAPTASTGPRPVTFTATSETLQKTVSSTVNVQPAAAPGTLTITRLAPQATVRGTRSQTIRVAGTGFVTGATAFFGSGGIRVERTVVYSPTLADVTITVPNDVAIGPHRIDLRNPDGVTTQPGGTLLVYPPDAIGAPLDVTTAAIVFPVEGTIVANRDSIFPRALLATTGTGTIVGYWALDGIPFDRFTATVAGGFPVEVRSNVPIPPSPWGARRLEIIIDSPRKVASPGVNVVFSADSATRLVIYAPRDRAVVDEDVPTFRWTLLPGVTGYEIEIDPDADGMATRRIRLTRSEWSPTREDLDKIAGGAFRWRVRGIYPGDVRGEPTDWARVIVTPANVKIDVEVDGATVRWAGGARGLLYRLDFVDHAGRRVFDALTWKSDYELRHVAVRDRVTAVRVSAVTPYGRVAGRSAQVSLPDVLLVRTRNFPSSRAIEVTSITPAKLASSYPLIEVRYRGEVSPADAAIFVDGTDVTAMSDLSDGLIRFAAIDALPPGRHTVRVSLAGHEAMSSFDVQDTQPENSAITPSLRRDYVVTPMGTITAAKDQDPNARLQLTTQSDVGVGNIGTKLTGDLSYAAQFDPSHTVQESRNWVTLFSTNGASAGAEAQLGYTTPSFTDGAEFLTSGVARTGVTARANFKGATVAYYQPFDTAIHGVLSNANEDLDIRSAAISTPEGKRYSARLIALQVEDPGNGDMGIAASKLDTFGIYGKFDVSPRLSIALEAARGEVNGTFGDSSRDGNAYRLALNGAMGTFTYGFNVREVGANFVNPANRALTPGGVADRLSTDLTLGKSFGQTALNLTLRRQDGGRSDESTTPETSQTGANLSLTHQFGPRVNFTVAANATHDDGDADETLFLPATDRSQSGISATFSENFGRFNASQTLSWQQTEDEINVSSSQDVGTINLSLTGTLTQNFNLSTNLGLTRTEADPIIGTTENLTLSLQPSIAVPAMSLSFQPAISWSTTDNDVTNSETENSSVQANVQWSPAMLNNMISAQVGASINRTDNSGFVSTTQTDRTYQGSVTLKLSKSRGVPLFPSSALPGTTPVVVPERAGTDAVQSSSSQPATTPAATRTP